MLSKQYHPSAADRIEEERPPMPIHRSGSIYGGKTGEKGVTLQDLQKLETLVDEADRTGDPETMRTALRRSLSRNVAPGCKSPVSQRNEELLMPSPGRNKCRGRCTGIGRSTSGVNFTSIRQNKDT